ncbi:glutamate synthase subunit beta [Castellaniella sp.]|uniref:glutamate synthase subunit beta n=1 Tax=Castellaniella sp. TaxID=1955812 RepID=UPI00355ED178
MDKLRGFMRIPRQKAPTRSPAVRVHDFLEFVEPMDTATARKQAARCMDCGIPYCSHGCPVGNIIPDWNDLVFRDDWHAALQRLLSTNNFPEFTGRICPAPCEAACSLALSDDPVGIKSIEHAIIERGWAEGWVVPMPAEEQTGKRVAIMGSGPAGLACAQQLARAGHAVTVFEKNDRIGGLLRYGIPDFKLEKRHIDRRIVQMEQEGVVFRSSSYVGHAADASRFSHGMAPVTCVHPDTLLREFDAIVMAGGSETPRDLPIPGRALDGVRFALDFLPEQNHVDAGDDLAQRCTAQGKRVIVIGGGDTGSDCVGTCNRQGAQAVAQFELMSMPPVTPDRLMTWPGWPLRLRTSSSHEEGCQRDWAIRTLRFNGDDAGRVRSVSCTRVQWRGREMVPVPDSAFDMPADLVLLAMGFECPRQAVVDAFGVARDARGNVATGGDEGTRYRTSVHNVFAAGDMRRGQSLVVWAIREGRQCARAVDQYLMGSSHLPR